MGHRRYLLNLDGHTAAYRLGHLLATNSLVLKQESTNMEHYYRSLRPFHHYVPILKHSEHDLMPRLHWARAKQHEAQVQKRPAQNTGLEYELDTGLDFNLVSYSAALGHCQ